MIVHFPKIRAIVKHEKISLFDVPKDSIIVHACNAKGIWGSGIAKEFKHRYPHSFFEYESFCLNKYQDQILTGKSRLSQWHKDEPHWVGWLITSESYGDQKDDKTEILANTALAVYNLCNDICRLHNREEWKEIPVYSNKFNSGLFGVPWEETELVLHTVLKHFSRIKWIVCDPELK